MKTLEFLGPSTPLYKAKLRPCRRCSVLSTNYFLCSACHRIAEDGEMEVPVKPLALKPPCSFQGCDSTSIWVGLCHAHYEQKRFNGVLKPTRRKNAA